MSEKPLLKTAAAAYKKSGNEGVLFNPPRDLLKEQIKISTEQMRSKNYVSYLHSIKWHEKCERVLERDDYTCVLCDAGAQHVHHLTYDRIYNESLYDLVSLCAECHEAIHLLDKK